jgi:hypothetical protein
MEIVILNFCFFLGIVENMQTDLNQKWLKNDSLYDSYWSWVVIRESSLSWVIGMSHRLVTDKSKKKSENRFCD